MTMPRSIALAMLAIGCSSSRPTVSSPEVTTVTVSRELRTTLHVDTVFNDDGFADLKACADEWFAYTEGRAKIDLVRDLDFNSISSLKEHWQPNDGVIIGILEASPLVPDFDKKYVKPGTHVLAITFPPTAKTPLTIYVVGDRIPATHFRSIMLHEFGHVLGLPDLEVPNAIMTGTEFPDKPPIPTFTAVDRDLCRAYRYCQ